MWRWVSTILIVLLVASNGWWLYQAADLAVTEKYRQQEEYEDARTITTLKAVTTELVRGMPKADLEALLARTLPDTASFEKEGAVNVDFLSFPVAETGNVIGVR